MARNTNRSLMDEPGYKLLLQHPLEHLGPLRDHDRDRATAAIADGDGGSGGRDGTAGTAGIGDAVGMASHISTTGSSNSLDAAIPTDTMHTSLPIQYCMVLGRLFKIHPEFSRIIANLLIASQHITPKVYIVFISEELYEWNMSVYEAIRQALLTADSSSDPSGDGSQAGPSDGDARDRCRGCMERVRFLAYRYYVDFLVDATAVLDTYPYGGMYHGLHSREQCLIVRLC